MKYISALCLSLMSLFSGCLKDDIDDLKERQKEQETRLAALEKWQETANNNISALQGLVTALENKDYVTSVTPVIENGKETGYIITFTKSNPIIIRIGLENISDVLPVVGAKKDADGIYYWTIQYGTGRAEWITDEEGNKIPTTGEQGITPQIRINADTNEWEISINGKDWVSLGVKATGNDGADGKDDSIFQTVTSDENNVIFTMADGITVFTLPKYKKVSIGFELPTMPVASGAKIEIPYIVPSGSEAPSDIRAVNVPTGWSVTADIADKKIIVTAPSNINQDNMNAEITLLLTDTDRQVWMHYQVLSLTAIDSDFNVYSAMDDEVFINYCKHQNFDGGDGFLSLDEAKQIKKVDLATAGITTVTSLAGIEYFPSLEYLNCDHNQLINIDVSKNTALTELHCDNNKLTGLDVKQNTKLTYLSCWMNHITELDVTQLKELTHLLCHSNQLTELDVRQNTELVMLVCSTNKLTELDVTQNTKLTYYANAYNQLTTFDITKNPELTNLVCGNNPLTGLDITKNPKLILLWCYENSLKQLDLSKNSELVELNCNDNQLITLDVTWQKKMTRLECHNNLLTRLDISGNSLLVNIDCSKNLLAKLDLPNKSVLTRLDCSENRLTELDITLQKELTYFNCSQNPDLETIWVWNDFDINNPPNNWWHTTGQFAKRAF